MWRFGLPSVLVAVIVCLASVRETAQAVGNSQNPIGHVSARPSGAEVCKEGQPFEFRPGVIVDPDRPAVYVMNQGHGIDAIDLSSGKLIWSTTRAAKPLLLHDDLLIAEAEGKGSTLPIVMLNTVKAGNPTLYADVALPEGVSASINERMGTSFLASASMHEDDLIVSWLFSHQQITGAAPGPDAIALNRQAHGVVRIDLKTGHIDRIESDEIPPPIELRLPDNVARLVESGAVPGPIWRAGHILATLARTGDQDRQGIILKRWNAETGVVLPEVTLFRGGLIVRFASADTRHVLASKLEQARGPVWLWWIFSLETGERVAVVRTSSPGAQFFVSGSNLIYESQPQRRLVNGKWAEEPLMLRAMQIETGAELWTHPVRETRYRGPYPPALPTKSGSPDSVPGNGVQPKTGNRKTETRR